MGNFRELASRLNARLHVECNSFMMSLSLEWKSLSALFHRHSQGSKGNLPILLIMNSGSRGWEYEEFEI